MKKKFLKLGFCAVFLSAWVSCSDDASVQQQLPQGEDAREVSLVAEIGERGTRSSVSETGQFSWLPGDKIMVLSENGRFYEFENKVEEQSENAVFKGIISGLHTTYAVSPASVAPGYYDGGALVLNLPYSFASEDKQANNPMVARFERGAKNLTFKNVAGLMMVYVNNLKAGMYNLNVYSDNQRLGGSFELVEDEAGNLYMPADNSSYDNNITISYASGDDGAKRAFYLPLPVGTYDRLTVSLTRNGEEWANKSVSNLIVERSKMVIMPTITLGTTPNTQQSTIASTESVVSDLNAALEQAAQQQQNETGAADLNITIAAAAGDGGIAEDETLTVVEIEDDVVIPVAITAAESTQEETPFVSLTFDAVPASTNQVTAATGDVVENVINVTDNAEVTPVAQESKSEVMISIPNVEAAETQEEEIEAPSFNINLPTSTVTLAAKGETALYDVVIASTAENTLRIDRGVTVNKVIIGTGNVLLKGTIGDIVNGSGKTIYVTIEEGGRILGVIPSNVIIINNAEESVEIAKEFDNESTADGIKVPYQISRLSQLRRMSLLVNGGHENKNMVPYYKCNYVLVNDIAVNTETEWEPIGSEGAPFRGTFDGANHTITANLKVSSGVPYAGLFGFLERATVKNLTLDGSVYYKSVDYYNPYVAGIAGYVRTGAVVENCVNKATITVVGKDYYTVYAAGIVGRANGYPSRCSITACVNEGEIHKTYGIGAGIACIIDYTDISACCSLSDEYYSFAAALYSDAKVIGCWGIKSAGIWDWSANAVVANCFWNSVYSWVLDSHNFFSNCGVFDGNMPTADQIEIMNEACAASGWMFDENARPVKSNKSGIPSIPVRPW